MAINLPRGRRPGKKCTKRLCLTLTPEEFETVQKCAYCLDVSMTETVRQGIKKLEKSLRNDGRWNKLKELEQ
jgi:hypothetical protein